MAGSEPAKSPAREQPADAPRRDRPLRRAGIAVAAAVVLMVVVLVVEQGGRETAVPPPPTESRLVAPEGDEGGVPVTGSAAGGAVSAVASPALSSDATPGASPAAPGPDSTPASDGDASPAPAAPAADSALAAPTTPPVSPAPSQPDPASIAGYRIQLGVFDVPANAETLQRELAAQGLPAHIQSRVVLGPFSTRAKAQAAQAALRKAGQAPGILVPPRGR